MSAPSGAARASGRRWAVAAALLLLPCAARDARAQEAVGAPAPDPGPRGDDLLPGRGGVSALFATGEPFLGLGELAYGVSDGFAVGALAAGTPDVGRLQGTSAVGVRPRGAVLRAGRWRSVLAVPVLYYPSLPGFGGARDPWVLARPEITLERRSDSGASMSLHLGVIAAACTESLLTLGREHDPTVMGGVWETVGLGAGVPITRRSRLFGEASLVLRGARPAADWIGVTPAIAIFGVATTLE